MTPNTNTSRAPHSPLADEIERIAAQHEAYANQPSAIGHPGPLFTAGMAMGARSTAETLRMALRASSESTPEPGSEKRPQADAEPPALPNAETAIPVDVARNAVEHWNAVANYLDAANNPYDEGRAYQLRVAARDLDAMLYSMDESAVQLPQDAPSPAPSSEVQPAHDAPSKCRHANVQSEPAWISCMDCGADVTPGASSEDGEPAQDEREALTRAIVDAYTEYGGVPERMAEFLLGRGFHLGVRLGVRRVSLPDAVHPGQVQVVLARARALVDTPFLSDSHKALIQSLVVTIEAFLAENAEVKP